MGALNRANLYLLLPLWTFAVLLVFAADTGCLVLLFRACQQSVSKRDLLVVKGASYLLNVINYNAAAGGIAYYVSKRTRAPLLESISSMLMLSGIDLLALTLFVDIAYGVNPDFLPGEYKSPILWICALLPAGYLSGVVIWKIRDHLPFLKGVSQWGILHCMRASRFRDQVLLIGLRFGFMCIYFVTQYFSLLSFGIEIPMIELCGYNAILTLVGIIPLSVAGLGTTQWAMVVLYTPYAVASLGSSDNAEAVILAYSTAMIGYFVLIRVVIGYGFFARLSEELREGFTPVASND